jgi:pilus assembly protein Flp/PilA
MKTQFALCYYDKNFYIAKEVIGLNPGNKYEKAQGLVEYALIFILVALLVIILIYIFGGSVGSMYSNVVETI